LIEQLLPVDDDQSVDFAFRDKPRRNGGLSERGRSAQDAFVIDAEPLYDRLLSLWEKLAGKDHPMVAITLDKLAALYLKEGKADKAREASARSITIRARFLAVSLLHQAGEAISAGDPAQAQALCSRALAALGSPDPADEDLIAQIRKTLPRYPEGIGQISS
jgi:hypothetical protein